MVCLSLPWKLPQIPTRRRPPPGIATCTSCFSCADLSCVSDSCSGKKTYIGSPNDNIPFGEEICSIADHIVRGQGFSSPFHLDTGPIAWVAPVYPYLVALVFRLFD